MARPKIDREYHIFDKQKKGIWHIDLRRAGGKCFSSGLSATKQNKKQLEEEIVPLLLKKLRGEANEEELREKLIHAKTAHTIAVFGAESLSRHNLERQAHIAHAYDLVFKKHILPYFGAKKLQNINGLHLIDWQNELNAKTGIATVKKARIIMMQMFDDACISEVLNRNPLIGTKLPRPLKEQAEIMPFSMQEIKALLNEASGYFRNVVGILLYTGMRPSELAALEWQDVSFETKEIFVRQTLKRDRTVGMTKTKAGKRSVDMLPPVEMFLVDQFKLTGLKGGRVFQSKIYKKGFTSIDYWQRAFTDIVKRANLIHRNLYQCRHTFASQMLSNGEDLLWVSSMLGHKSPDITLKCYSKHIKAEKKERAKWLEESKGFCYDFCYVDDSTKEETL